MDPEDNNSTFAAQIEKFHGIVTLRSPLDIWQNHPTFLVQEITICLAALINFIHAYKNGGYHMYYWWATVVLSVTTELVCYYVPELDNFWHSQSVVMFAHGRYPLYIVLLYNAFYYPAMVAVSRLRLPWWAESFAVGLCSTLLDVPYDILGVKLLHWVWHDTDSALADRTYWVPWTSYHFHTAFSAALHALFFGLRRLLLQCNSWRAFGQSLSVLMAGLLGMPVGSLFFLLYYHPLHDHYGVHSEVPVLMFLATCALIVWLATLRADRAVDGQSSGERQPVEMLVLAGVTIQYMTCTLFALLAKPENIVRTGLAQMTGPCDAIQTSVSLSGKDLHRNKYLCVTHYDEGYFDWHCRQKPPGQLLSWYTLCGTPFPNHTEYIAVVTFFCSLGWIVYYQLLVGKRPMINSSKASAKKKTR